MFSKITYKNKCILLFGGFTIFLFVGYGLSFSDTFELAAQVKEKEGKLDWFREKEKELPMLKTKMQEFDKVCSKTDSVEVRDKLTAWISEFAEHNNCLVTEIPANLTFKNKQVNIETNTFTVKGNFHNLLKLLNGLESDCKYVSKIMSSRFHSVKDMQTKRKSLYLTIITQSYRQI